MIHKIDCDPFIKFNSINLKNRYKTKHHFPFNKQGKQKIILIELPPIYTIYYTRLNMRVGTFCHSGRFPVSMELN